MKPGTVFRYRETGLLWLVPEQHPAQPEFGKLHKSDTPRPSDLAQRVIVVWEPPVDGPEHGIAPADVTAMAPAVDSKIAFAAKKVPLEMIPLRELFGAARVSQYGGKKHGKGNYLKASLSDGAGERYPGAFLRHIGDMQNPDGTWDAKSLATRDEESGLPHIDHAIRGLLMLRGILIKDGVLPADPGEGKEPPKVAP